MMMRKLPRIMEMLTRMTRIKSDYVCKCARCQAERAGKSHGIRGWRKRNKDRNLFDREGMS